MTLLTHSQLPTKIQCLSPMTVSRIVLPLILKAEHFSEPGSEIIFGELFGVKYDTDPLLKKKKSLTIIREDSEVFLLSKEVYVEQVLPFIKSSILMRQYDARMLCLRLVERQVDHAHQLINLDTSTNW